MQSLLKGAASVAMLVLGIVAYAPPSNLIPCLQNICGDPNPYLVTPSSSTYNSDRVGFNINFNYKPIAIYHPATEHDAAAAIRCAAANNVAIAPRSGGHSFEGYGQGGKDGSLIIDLNQFQQFSIDKQTHVATVGAGTRLGPLYSRLWKAGEYLVPAGTCPSVGVGGHALGGGIGMVSRKYGVLTDSIVGMKMLDATGTTRHINGTSDADLFWALRGAGGRSFGLMTESQIQCYDAPANVTTLSLAYPIREYRKVNRTYGIWGKQVTEDLMAIMYMSRSSLTVLINFACPKQDALLAIWPLPSLRDTISPRLPPNQPEISEGSWYQAAIRWGGPLLENLDPGSQYQYARGRSLLYRELLIDIEMDLLYQFVNNPSNFTTYVLIDLWGGRIDQPQHSLSSAFDIHRGVLYGIQYVTTWTHPTQVPGFTCSECMKWSSSTSRKLQAAYKTHPTSMEAYQNYIERDMPNALLACYGAHLPRLQQIKTNVDPYNVFSFPQSIPLIAE